MPGRPGVNGKRLNTIYKVSADDILQIKNIAEKTGINASDISRSEGYLSPFEDGIAELGALRLKESHDFGIENTANSRDINRIKNAITEAKFFSDYVLVSIHSHQIQTKDKESYKAVGYESKEESGSTDANIPLSQGIPAICAGAGISGNAHRLDKKTEIEALKDGMYFVLELISKYLN